MVVLVDAAAVDNSEREELQMIVVEDEEARAEFRTQKRSGRGTAWQFNFIIYKADNLTTIRVRARCHCRQRPRPRARREGQRSRLFARCCFCRCFALAFGLLDKAVLGNIVVVLLFALRRLIFNVNVVELV